MEVDQVTVHKPLCSYQGLEFSLNKYSSGCCEPLVNFQSS